MKRIQLMQEDPQEVKRTSQRRAFYLLFFWILLFSAFSCYHPINKTNPYGLDIIADIGSYNRLVAMDSNNAMVNINILIPGIVVDIKYASRDNFKSGKELEMPTVFDDFTEKASHSYMELPAQVLQNRQILKDIMVKYGFIPLADEWWHYDFHGWDKYDLMDVSFRELQ